MRRWGITCHSLICRSRWSVVLILIIRISRSLAHSPLIACGLQQLMQGAEVIRLYHTLLGAEGFRSGSAGITCITIIVYTSRQQHLLCQIWFWAEASLILAPQERHGSLFQATWWSSGDLWWLQGSNGRCQQLWSIWLRTLVRTPI